MARFGGLDTGILGEEWAITAVRGSGVGALAGDVTGVGLRLAIFARKALLSKILELTAKTAGELLTKVRYEHR